MHAVFRYDYVIRVAARNKKEEFTYEKKKINSALYGNSNVCVGFDRL